MRPYDVVRDIIDTGAMQNPRMLLMQRGRVMEWYPTVGADGAEAKICELLDSNGSPVTVYAVDERLPDPVIGERVQDVLLRGWVEIGRETVENLHL